MCTPVDEILARRVAAEGPALAIKDGIGLISPILNYIHSVSFPFSLFPLFYIVIHLINKIKLVD